MPSDSETGLQRPAKAVSARRRVREAWPPSRFTLALTTAAREAERVVLTADDPSVILKAAHALAAVCGASARLQEPGEGVLTHDAAAALVAAVAGIVVDELRRVGATPDAFSRISARLDGALAAALPATA